MRSRIIAICMLAASVAGPAFGRDLTVAEVNGAELGKGKDKNARPVLIRAQVLLDRAGFSPGVIDGRNGSNFVSALRAFQKQNGLKESGELDPPTWAKLLEASADPALADYAIKAEDTKGPFVEEIPDKLEKKAELKRLAYTGPTELLAEKFHMDEDLLEELNKGKALDQPGTSIVVANVPQESPKIQVQRIVVEKNARSVRAFDRAGKLIGFYPASIGSHEKPAPSGTLKITRVVRDPVYFYDPKFQFRGVKAQQKLKIAPGPNGPVGSVWMNLNEKPMGFTARPSPPRSARPIRTAACA